VIAAGFLGQAGFWMGMAVLIGAALVPVAITPAYAAGRRTSVAAFRA
jgi:hypothetical protein